MDLVTGHAGTEHISAADVACMLRCMYGEQDGVYAVDGQLACTVQSANLVEIATGALSVQGYFARIDIAEQLTVDSGTPGYRRYDLVVARYELGEGNVQSMTLAVVKGTPTTQGEATDPSLTEGDIDGGDVLAEFALWRIPIDGVNVGDPVRVLPLLTPFLTKADAQDDAIQTLRDSVDGLGYVKAWMDNTTIPGVWVSYVQFSGGVIGLDNYASRIYIKRHGSNSWYVMTYSQTV